MTLDTRTSFNELTTESKALPIRSRILFDVTDLLNFLEYSKNVTGIQRVQLEAVRAQISDENTKVECCYFSRDRLWHTMAAPRFLEAFEKFDMNPETGVLEIALLRKECLNNPEVAFADQDVLYFLGATWSLPGFFESLRDLRESGVRFAFFIHDLLPLKHPEYFDKTHAIASSYWFNNVLFWADTLICNSPETKADIDQFTNFEGPVSVASLNIRPPFLNLGIDETAAAGPSILTLNNLDHVPFILMVGTVEPRKNHIAAINAWSVMKAKLGDACPKLVLVGKTGWKYEAIFHLIEAMNRDDGIVWLQSVSEVDLGTLYSSCLFSLYISRAEGWGLPITESLAAGKVCVSGYASGSVEACQSLTVQTDEQSERDITATIMNLVQNPGILRAAENRIRKEAQFKTWSEYTQDLVECGQSVLLAPRKDALATLGTGVSYAFGQAKAVSIGAHETTGEILRTGKNWHHPDVWGSWVSANHSGVAFRVPRAGKYDCYIMVKAPPGGAEISVKFRSDTVWCRDVTGDNFLKFGLGKLAPSEAIHIEIVTNRVADLSKDDTTADQRILGCAWRELRIIESNDLEARLEALEHFVSL